MSDTISWNDFAKVDLRVGTIIQAEVFKEAKKPAYKLVVDFGETLGKKRSSAQITKHYTPEDLIGRQVIAVINFPVKQIASFFSECLVLGTYDKGGEVILLQPERSVNNGADIG